MKTLCVECGPHVKIDSEGCCWTCGNVAVGSWLDKATKIDPGKVVIVVRLRDRHFDDVTTIHSDAASAEGEIAKIKDGYAHTVAGEWQWMPREKAWRSYDDGPSIHVGTMKAQGG